MAKKTATNALPRWELIRIAKKGQRLAIVRAKDAESAIEDYAKAHGEDPKRMMAIRIEE